MPNGWQSHKFNGPNQAVVEDGVVTFHIFDRQCSDIKYGDGRGESDCLNGAVRSAINHTGRQQRLGETVEYRFDLLVDPSFDFAPFRNPDAVRLLPGGIDSRLRIASWEGTYLHNFIYLMKADAQRGITFTGAQCQAPEDFGTWVTVSVTIKWASQARGWVKVTCNGRLVYADEDVATNQAPHCYPTNQCEPGIKKDPREFNFLLGPVAGGYGGDYAQHGFESPFDDIQPDGIIIKTRNMSITQGGELYGAADKEMVSRLQKALNALGCDVGFADGIAGPKTKSVARSCRDFGWDMPEKFTVAAVPDFLTLYESADVDAESDSALPQTRVTASATSETVGSGDHVINVNGQVETLGGSPFDLDFIVIGRFDESGRTSWLDVLLEDDLGQPFPTVVAACPSHRTETWGDGSTHVVIRFSSTATGFRAVGGQCLLDALPAATADEARFLLTDFQRVAAAIDGTDLDLEGPRTFIEKAASGDISLRM